MHLAFVTQLRSTPSSTRVAYVLDYDEAIKYAIRSLSDSLCMAVSKDFDAFEFQHRFSPSIHSQQFSHVVKKAGIFTTCEKKLVVETGN